MNPRELTKNHLQHEMNKIVSYYMQIYDEYYTTGSRDSAFLKDLTDAIIGISAVLEVYVTQKSINSGYALEKLNWSKSIIQSVINYFERKNENE